MAPARMIGAIGDVHAEDDLLACALDALRREQVDVIVCVGDVVDGPGDLERCVDFLEANNVLCVRGNHDRWLLQNRMRDLPGATRSNQVSDRVREYLASLPTRLSIETCSGSLLLCHGLGENDTGSLLEDDEGYALEVNDDLQALLGGPHRHVLAGHTHRRMVRRFPDLTVINAGTLVRTHQPCIAVPDMSARRVQFFDLADGAAVLGADHDLE